jgi:hypothetical protein
VGDRQWGCGAYQAGFRPLTLNPLIRNGNKNYSCPAPR